MPRRPALRSLVAVLLALAASAVGCKTETSDRPERGGTLTVVLGPGGLDHVDPQRVADRETAELLGAYVLRTLTTRSSTDDNGVSVVPDLSAGPPDISTDRTTWTFRLRDGILFDNARPLTCADVKYGVSRAFARELGNDGSGLVSVLDIPIAADGTSEYRGPYATAGRSDVAAFDRAVECSPDGREVTFRLRKPVGAFDEWLADPVFAPVPVGSDIGLGYEQRPVGTGPYRVEERTGGTMSLVRNLHWNASTDPHRAAYPDRITVVETPDPDGVARGLLGNGGRAVDPATVGPAMSAAQLAGLDAGLRATLDERTTATTARGTLATGPDLWSRQIAIDTWRITDPRVRQAIQAALDRTAIRDALVGPWGGDLTDSLIPPSIPLDHRSTGLWTGLGGGVGEDGSADLARELLADDAGKVAASGRPSEVPALRLDHPDTAPDAAAAAIVVARLRAAGFDARARAVPVDGYTDRIRSPDLTGELIMLDYAPQVPAGIVTLTELLGADSPLHVSHWGNDKSENALTLAAMTPNRAQQSEQVAVLDARAVQDGAVVPLFTYRTWKPAGPLVGNAELTPRGTWAYAQLWVRSNLT
ncbi:hypothetical protein Pth03_53360 [Planotetraspora thailandica]|uniref:Solute-binding protein family 5 domain-containing protein n=1 Tax=Planotetraspora thailandica TaxID=487172 RepID=A0A8J3XVV8_9ACTN|nr:ABC transporter substrate-binding protein [Planotetraspora thailandica]GII56947.1 hypothetical protein Pth03_53360 [Planotetraspora thailandica]